MHSPLASLRLRASALELVAFGRKVEVSCQFRVYGKESNNHMMQARCGRGVYQLPVNCRTRLIMVVRPSPHIRNYALNRVQLLLASAWLVVVATDTTYAQEKRGLDAIQGRWKLIDMQIYDSELTKRDFEKFTLAIDGNRMTFEYENGRKSDGHKFRLMPQETPKRIDFSTGGAAEKQDRFGIYLVDDDVLKICFDTVVPAIESRRPTDFTTPAGSGRILMSLKRVMK